MLSMVRARWYGFVRTLPFWSSLGLLFVIASISAGSFIQGQSASAGDLLGVFQAVPVAPYLVICLSCLWLVSATTFDEKEDALVNLLVGPESRRDYVVAAMICFCLQFLCATAAFLAGFAVGTVLTGQPLSLGAEFAPTVLARWLASFAVALGYGALLLLLTVAIRRSAAVVIAAFVVLFGVVEQAVFRFGRVAPGGLPSRGALEKLSLYGQVETLCDGDVPTIGATVFALVLAAAFTALAVAVLRRRRA